MIYLLVGPPGAGKSTWAKLALKQQPAIIISRDEIRYSLLEEGDSYFSKEKLVFEIFVSRINEAIESNLYENIYIDATHLNVPSRAKILNRINATEITAVNFIVPIETVIARNNQRVGRACVPEETIERMYDCFVPASVGECGKIINVIEERE